ncbi:MAG: hypothetical protein M1839_006265 [Geoglossum umbratile]|nr:MAG: hypothetical protein M1839_006265 [Geoglossum umbratile]
MYPNFLAFFLSVLEFIEYGSKLAWADKEIETYRGIISSTSDLLSHVSLAFQTLGASLVEERERWVRGEIQRTQTALANAINVVEKRRTGKSLGGRRLRGWVWVLRDREAAEAYKSVVLQCHSTLLGINLELALAEETLSACGHVENTAQRKGLWGQRNLCSKDRLCVGTLCSRSASSGQQRHPTFPMMRLSQSVSQNALPAAATRPPTYPHFEGRGREEADINSWLLKNAMRKAR